MTVYLCGASIDENGRASGGKAGDQTGKEVRKTPWYKYGGGAWSYVLRMEDPKQAEVVASSAEQIAAQDRVGYDQGERNSLFNYLRKGYTIKNIPACELDCTALGAVCVYLAGGDPAVLYSGGNLPYSGNFDTKVMKAIKCQKLTASKYLTSSDYLKRGDILIKAGHHCEVVVSNGSKATESNVSPAKPQTAPETMECCIQAAYNGTEAQSWNLEGPSGEEIVAGAWFSIVNRNGQCLDVTGGSTRPVENGREVYLHKANGTPAQLFRLEPSPVGGYRIVSALDEGFVLDSEGGKLNARAAVRLHKKQDEARKQWAQSWHIIADFSGGYAFVNAKSFFVLDANPKKLKY